MFTTLIHLPIDMFDNIVIIVIIITNPSLSSFIPIDYHLYRYILVLSTLLSFYYPLSLSLSLIIIIITIIIIIIISLFLYHYPLCLIHKRKSLYYYGLRGYITILCWLRHTGLAINTRPKQHGRHIAEPAALLGS